MLQHILRDWRDRHLSILLFLSLVVLFCIYCITLPSALFINIGTRDDERYVQDFHSREQGELYSFRWTKDSSYIKIPNLGSLPLEITLGADAARPEGQPLPKVSLIANGTVLAHFTMENGIWAHQFLYYPPLFPLPRDLLLEVKSDPFFPPGDEYRALGILLNTVEVKPIISPFRLLQVCLIASLMGALSISFGYLLLRWLGLPQKSSLVCGIIVLALFGFGIIRQFIVARFLIGVFGLLLVGYVLTIFHSLYKDSRYFQSGGISDVFPAYLPAAVLFVLMPFALYLPNQEMFDNDLTLVLPFLVLAVVYFVFLVALLFFVSQPLRTRTVIILFYIGIYLSLSDMVAPVQLGELMGGRETPQEPLFLTVVEVGLAVAVILCATKLPWNWVKRFGSIFVLLLLISEVVVVFNGLLPEAHLSFTRSTKNLSNPPEKLAEGGNIYHITLDGYSGASLLDSLETMKLMGEFDGFTFFKNNRANYGYTMASLPSYMTGSLYEENGSLKEWKERHNSSGIVDKVYDAGYKVSMYAPYSVWIHEQASYVKMHEDVLMQYESLSSYSHFADLWLLRVVPNYLQQEVYREGKGVFTRLFVKDELAGKNWNVFGSVELMRQLINDEADRPDHGQYVYAHLWIPHSPYIMNRDCIFSPDDSRYDEQALCATGLVAELISKLKELGRYHEATIIIQADHGTPGYPCLKDTSDCIPSLEIEKEMEAVNLRKLSAEVIDNRTRALLLIKPPLQSGKPLVISDRPTQLADIPATLYDLLDLPVRVREGESVFAPDFPATREIHIFIGLCYQEDERGKARRFGQNLFVGEANHFSFTNGKGWKIYPNIHVQWE